MPGGTSPHDPYTLGMRALTAYHLAEGGYGQAQDIIEARTGVRIGRAQLAGVALRTSPSGSMTSTPSEPATQAPPCRTATCS